MNESISELVTIKEFCLNRRLNPKTIYIRIYKSNIEPVKRGNPNYYNIFELELLIKPVTLNFRNKLNKEKILIIEYLLGNNLTSSVQIGRELGISKTKVQFTINEWLNNDNCVLIESKINKNDSTRNKKNIRNRHNK